MITTRSGLLEAVHLLDPERDGSEVDSEALLLRVRSAIATTPELDHDPVPHPVPRQTRRLTAGAAAATLLAAVVVTVSSLGGGSTAYASWTPTPTELTAADAAADAAVCPQVALRQGPPGDPTDLTEVPLTPVLAERRGDYTFVVSVGDSSYSECLVTRTPDGPVAAANDLLAPPGLDLRPTSPDGITAVNPGDASWGDDATEGDITSMVGAAGSDVDAIEVRAADGTTAQAAISGGWWSVWFPGSVQVAGTVTVTTTDGERHEVDVEDVALLTGDA